MQVFKGNNGEYMLVFARGEKVMEGLITFAKEEGITAARFSGIGAVEDAELCYYDLPVKKYICATGTDIEEVVSMNGNITLVDGAPFVHAHAALGDRGLTVRGGHVKEMTVAVTLEVSLVPLSIPLSRTHNDEIGLKLISS